MGDTASQKYELVIKAITNRVGGCCIWEKSARERLLRAPPVAGITPNGLIQELRRFVEYGGRVTTVVERRPEYSDRDVYFKAVMPFSELKHGLFVEMILHDEDAELPVVMIVNCHQQRK